MSNTQQEIPCCGNCPLCFKQGCPYHADGQTTHIDGDGYILGEDSVMAATQILGCLSHPNARAYLMEDVVEELENQKERNELEYKSAQSYGFRLERKGKVLALKEAIALIKGGVK